jgi:DNA-damage-inducible protein J
MNKAATVQARIDFNLKQQADMILHRIGLSASQAINALYAQIVLRKGIPFELRIPSDITLQAIHELENGGGEIFSNFHDMINDLENMSA